MRIQTTKDIETESRVLDHRYDFARGAEAEHKADLKRCDFRIKKWVALDDLLKIIDEVKIEHLGDDIIIVDDLKKKLQQSHNKRK